MVPFSRLGSTPVTSSRNPAPAPSSRAPAPNPLSAFFPLAALALLFCIGGVKAADAPGIEAPETEAPAIAIPKTDTAQAPSPVAAPAVAPPAAAAPAAPPSTVPAPAFEAAQTEPGPDDVVIEVDPGQSRNKDKSLPLAMLLSAALPGTGELYLHEKSAAKSFLLTEAGFWASLYVAYLAKETYLSSARNYASDYAGIDASSKSETFLEVMGNYRSYQEKQHRQDSYELSQQLSGKRDRDYDIPAVEGNYWDFGSSVNPENTRNWRTFQSTLRYYRASKVAISFAIGALALNRLASLANTLRAYKRTSSKSLGFQVIPEVGPDYTGARLSLGF